MSKYIKEEQKEHRRMWVEALRSGEYEQGKGVLCHKDEDDENVKYCCLGVACEISGLGEFVPRPNFPIAALNFATGEEQSQHVVLPYAVRDWLGLGDEEGSYHNGSVSLTRNNDAGVPFTSIANIIESEPEGLVA